MADAIIGAGRVARHQLLALCAENKFERVIERGIGTVIEIGGNED